MAEFLKKHRGAGTRVEPAPDSEYILQLLWSMRGDMSCLAYSFSRSECSPPPLPKVILWLKLHGRLYTLEMVLSSCYFHPGVGLTLNGVNYTNNIPQSNIPHHIALLPVYTLLSELPGTMNNQKQY